MSNHDQAHWQKIAKQLAAALQTDVVWGHRNREPDNVDWEGNGCSFIPVDNEWGLWVKGPLTSREQNLLALFALEQGDTAAVVQTETPQQKLLSWLQEVDQVGSVISGRPDPGCITVEERVPFCVVTDGVQQPMREEEVNRVLGSFFDGQVWVLSVTERATFILPLASLIYEGNEAERWQETLWHWAEGLVELFASEMGEDVRACVHPPVGTTTALAEAWLSLKQVLLLGETMHSRQTVLATWGMALERLINRLPQEDRRAFLEDVASESHSWWRDVEMRETLETFFRLNLNVSETARQLFLHRNTLIYRLDKLKQETGRDVRQFAEAMLIHMALLLTADKI